MASSPHLSPRIAVLVLTLLVTVLASKWAMSTRGYPGDLLRWPERFLARVVDGLRRGGRSMASWAGIGLYSAVITALHFWGIASNTYTTLQWYDAFTHAASGVGVAVLLYLTFHRPTESDRSTAWIVPAVLAFGAGFEVYEFVFKDFWYTWPLQYYLVDTVADLLFGVVGAVAVVAILVAYRTATNRSR